MTPEQHPFLAGLPVDFAGPFLACLKVKGFSAGEVVYDEGDEPDSFCLVLEGRVRFEKHAGNGDSKLRIVGEAGAGEAFGEMGAVLRVSRFLRVTVSEAATLAFIPAEKLREVWDSMNPLARRLGDTLMRHLCDTTGRYVEDAGRQERLAVLGTMVSSLSHDLRTPITLINLNAQLIETVGSTADPRLAAVLAKHCRNIEAQVERMMGMFEEISDYSNGRASDDYARIDLLELFETFRFLNSPYWETAGVAVEFTGAKVSVDAAPRKLLRVLQNLVGNAVDAMEGRTDGRIVIEAVSGEPGYAVITVTDNGPGIPEKIRANFWEPFVTSGKARGTGLGTAICRTLVESHGGRINFSTETDKGTRFEITLPVKRPKAGTPGLAPAAMLRSSGA